MSVKYANGGIIPCSGETIGITFHEGDYILPKKMVKAIPGKVFVTEVMIEKYGEQFLKNINGSDDTELVII